jgi:8-oxo-dGTP pyrophosphatase MutT (NUDIX family)
MTAPDLRRAFEDPDGKFDAPVVLPEGRHAAVAAVFSADLDVLLVQRTTREGDPWSGHLALPGGRLEPDETPLDAAVRETLEEVGLALDRAWLVGAMPPVVAAGGRPGMVVYPHVFLLPGDLPPSTCQIGEVECTLQLPLATLWSPGARSTMRWKRGNGVELDLPQVAVPGTEVPLWGLTLHILDLLSERLRSRP